MRWPEVSAIGDRVHIVIGSVGVSITSDESRQLRLTLAEAELDVEQREAGTLYQRESRRR